ncbi:MAG: threonylcarbamoyladenosine tRNA methylthiotransferase MtaB, partial [Gammaproteobacteria bacterium]
RLGYSVSNDIENADFVVINTCAVTQEAVKKSRQLIRKSQRINPHAKLIVSGCYSSLNPDVANEIDSIDLLVSNENKDRLAQIVNDELTTATMPGLATDADETALFIRGRNRAFIKIQDGCRYQCTFCIVTKARGNERSKAIEDVINEINALQQQEIKEVVLTGVHIGGYGSDIDSDLCTLIKTVLEETDVPRLRLGSVEPWDLTENFIELFSNPRFMPHLHLPLQSGSNTVLRRMARRCNTDDFNHLLGKIRSSVADFNVSTDIIVGFPGESDKEWQESLSYIESCDFSHIHIFPYSPRQGTRAANIPEQVLHQVKKDRTQQLHLLAMKMKKKVLQNYSGRQSHVLFENQVKTEVSGEKVYLGYTPNYIKVKLSTRNKLLLTNQIYQVNLRDYDEQSGLMIAGLRAPSESRLQ